MMDHADPFGVDPVEPFEVLARRLARNDHGRCSTEGPLEPPTPPQVMMRGGLGHHVSGEVVHHDDGARR